MNIEDFFTTRMRNYCVNNQCDATTEWRNSIEEVLADTLEGEWQTVEQVKPRPKPVPNYQYGNMMIQAGNATTAGTFTITSGSGHITSTPSYSYEEDQPSSLTFDSKFVEMKLGSIQIELRGTRWFCKDCAYKIKLENLLL